MLQAAQWGRLLSAGSILNIFWKAEAGGSGVQGHICLHSKPQSSLGYRLPCLETKQQKCRLKSCVHVGLCMCGEFFVRGVLGCVLYVVCFV